MVVMDPCTMLLKEVFLELVNNLTILDNEIQKEMPIQFNNNEIMISKNNWLSVMTIQKTTKVTLDSHSKEQSHILQNEETFH